MGRCWPTFGRRGPNLTKTWNTSTKSGRHWPNCGPRGANLAQIQQTSVNLGRMLVEYVSVEENLAKLWPSHLPMLTESPLPEQPFGNLWGRRNTKSTVLQPPAAPPPPHTHTRFAQKRRQENQRQRAQASDRPRTSAANTTARKPARRDKAGRTRQTPTPPPKRLDDGLANMKHNVTTF